MNQIGWCLEEIQMIMNKLPKEIDTNDKIILANDILSKVMNLAITLEKVISDKDFKNILYQLEHQTIEGIKFQAEHIEKTFNRLHQMLDFLNKYILNLRRIIDDRKIASWGGAARNVNKIIFPALTNKSKELNEELKIIEKEKTSLWRGAAGDINKMIFLDFTNKYYELNEELRVALHTEKQLKQLSVYEEHFENIKK